MINLYADYHTHTIYSHGKGTILDNVIAARKKGLKEIAITDHGHGHFSFGIQNGDLKKMRGEIDRINENCYGIRVLLGVEANLINMDGDIDVDDSDSQYLDIVLLGYHTAILTKSFKDFKGLYLDNLCARLIPSLYDEVKARNTQVMINAIKRNKINIITHPGAKIPIDTAILAKEAAKVGTALEINSSHGCLTVDYIRIAVKEGASFVINSDAHCPEFVGRFERGIEAAQEAGLPVDKIINAEKY